MDTKTLQLILPRAKRLGDFAPFLGILDKYRITTSQRQGAFFAQVGEESNNMNTMLEEASGSEYEGRVDLGNTEPGDGVKFKGRGLIQITGRNNYKEVSHALFNNECLLTTPSLLESPQYALESACYFWEIMKNINTVCDRPEDWVHNGPHHYTKLQWITILVNGGLNGYDVRLANYTRARHILNF